MTINFTRTGPGHLPNDVDGWARNDEELHPFQLLTGGPPGTFQNTLLLYGGPPGTGWYLSYQDPYGGFTPQPLIYEESSGDLVALGIVAGVGDWTADARWTPRALCTEQVVRSKSLSLPTTLEGYDEVIPSTGEVLSFNQPSTPPPNMRVVAVTGRGLVWEGGHARGYCYKVGSRSPNRIAGQSITYRPL